MKVKILIALTVSSLIWGCGSRYYLQRAKINTYKALARGAKIDSLKTVTHDTITVQGIGDVHTIKEVTIDTVLLEKLCPEIKTHQQQITLQRLVCPDVGIDTTYRINVIVDGLKHPILVHVVASSRGGEVKYGLAVQPVKMGYRKAVYSENVTPGEGGIKWWHVVIVGLVCLVIGYVLGKIFSVGVKL